MVNVHLYNIHFLLQINITHIGYTSWNSTYFIYINRNGLISKCISNIKWMYYIFMSIFENFNIIYMARVVFVLIISNINGYIN
jgi:hypothetical protein